MTSDLQDALAKKSGLTETQIQTIILQKSVHKGELRVSEALRQRARDGGDAVTPGAYYRVLEQARCNIYESLYTLLLCSRLNVLKIDDLRRLLDTIAKTPAELDSGTSQQVSSLLEVLIRRIVML